ncbi:MAG TPA: aminotransferase class IV [Gemmatirosa sp.]
MRCTPRAGFPDGLARLDGHLDRLAASATSFGFADPTAAVVAALRREVARLAGEPQRWRVRLDAHADGRAVVASALLPPDASRVQTAALARTPVDRAEPFLQHKTTHRAVYDARRAERTHVDDVLLWNAEGELTEFTTGSVVVELGGRRWTPPAACGLLAGVFRNELVARGLVGERVLRASDLAGARVWSVSSLREWVPIEVTAQS